MSVNVIDTIKPKNGGSFPVVEAVDVAVSGGTRLDAALADKASTADLAALGTAIDKKANQSEIYQLRSEMALKAAQSSLDATNVIVASKAAQSSLDALSVVVSNKADKSDYSDIYAAINTKASRTDLDNAVSDIEHTMQLEDDNLQNQIDQIEISASAEAVVAPEVIAARVDSESTIHATLKARLDSSQKELRHGFKVVTEKYVHKDTGALIAHGGYEVTDFIPATFPIVVKSNVANDDSGICFYNENKQYISGYNPYSDNETETTLEYPEGTKYVRISCKLDYADYFICRYDDTLTHISDDITGLSDAVYNIKEEIQHDFKIYDEVYAKKDDGTIRSSAQYFTTDFIATSAPILVRTYVQNDDSGICFYNGNKQYISGYNPYSDNGTEVLLEYPEGAKYVRVTSLVQYSENFICRYDDALTTITNKISELNFDVENIKKEIQHDFALTANIYVNRNNGVAITHAAYYATDFIPATIPLAVMTYVSNDDSGICFYDEHKVFISGYNPYSDNETEVVLEYPPKTKYVRISCRAEYVNNFSCRYDNALTSIAASQVHMSNAFWAHSMWKVMCIGDSLTSGACYAADWSEQYYAGASIDENYPRFLGRMINGDVTNAGFSGYTASDWWNNKNSSYSFNNYDTFIIWLGTNNGLTDTLDADVEPYSDYNDYADTDTGNYCKIIEKIKEQNESCLIVLTKIFATTGNLATTNAVIEKIAQKYSLPVIDNSDLNDIYYPELHAGIRNPHFGKAGNIFIANRYINEVSAYFAENPLRCEYHYTTRKN